MPDILIKAILLLQAKLNFSGWWIKGQDAVLLVPWGMVNEEQEKYSDLK